MTKEELEKEYYAYRPTEPYSEDDSPNDWANIAHYAEDNLDKAFKIIVELEKENSELKLYAKALEETDNTNILHCIKVNGQLYKAKGIIQRAKGIIQNIIDDWMTMEGEQVRELKLVKEAEQFLKESE